MDGAYGLSCTKTICFPSNNRRVWLTFAVNDFTILGVVEQVVCSTGENVTHPVSHVLHTDVFLLT